MKVSSKRMSTVKNADHYCVRFSEMSEECVQLQVDCEGGHECEQER